MATTWSTTNKNAHITLSNGNLTATNDATRDINYAGRSDTSFSTGSKYWEEHVDQDNGSSIAIGIANSSETYPDNQFLGLTANSVASYTDGNTYCNSVIVSGGGGINNATTGDTFCYAVIAGASAKLWIRVNGGNWNNAAIGSQNPATNTGGIDIAALGFTGAIFPAMNTLFLTGATPAGALTANFGATAFAFTPPAGFVGLDTSASLALAATEAKDTTAIAVGLTSFVALAATEAKDTTAIAAALTSFATLATTDTPDTTAIAVGLTNFATLAATESPDATAISVALAATATLATTEAQDVASFVGSVSGGQVVFLNPPGGAPERKKRKPKEYEKPDIKTRRLAAFAQSRLAKPEIPAVNDNEDDEPIAMLLAL